MSTFVRVLVATLLTLGGVLTALPAAGEGDTIGIAGAPAAADATDGRSRFSYEIEPGQAVTDHYLVRNTGSLSQEVTVFATDAYNTADGAFALLDTGATPKDAGAWTSFSGQPAVTTTLGPGEEQVLEFTVVVPADASPGDHAAGIVVSAMSLEGQVRIDRRVATRMYVRVAGDLQPRLTLSSIASSQQLDWNPFTGTMDVTVTIRNQGNVALSGDLLVAVETWFGFGTGVVAHQHVEELLPGATRKATFTLSDVPRWGYLHPVVTLRPTTDEGAPKIGELNAVVRDTNLVSPPWLILAVMVALAGTYVWARWRRARLVREAAVWVAHEREQARLAATSGEQGSEQ